MKNNSTYIGIKYAAYALCCLILASCGIYNQNIMFRTDKGILADTLLDALSRTEQNYVVKTNDYIDVLVYTNKGERLVDPNQQMNRMVNGGVTTTQNLQNINQVKYLVQADGKARLPMIGEVMVQGYTLRQLDSLLATKYQDYYEDVFVYTRLLNKRVFVLGNTGAGTNQVMGRVLPLDNENMSVVEILTIAGGLDQLAKSHNIRLIRGDLKNPNVYLIDLSTIEGVKKSHMNVQPNDIIYVERQRKRVSQTLQEITPLIGLVNTLLILFLFLNQR